MKTDCQDQKSLREAFERSLLPRLRTLARSWPFPLYLVGGLVRDWVREAKAWERDIDLTSAGEVPSLAQQAARLFRGRPIPLDENTWRVLFREGKDRWQLDLSGLRGEDISMDLKGRDFTLNAMAIEIKEGPLLLHDPLRGQADLASGRIRWCSPRCFQDDPLRLLRAVRFNAQLGFTMDDETWEGMRRASPLLKGISRERIRDEFFKILSQSGSAGHIQTLKELGLLEVVIPGISGMYQLAQGAPHRLPLWDHSLSTVQFLELAFSEIEEIAPEWSPLIQGRLSEPLEGEIDARQVLKLAALLHDIGKPLTRTQDEQGRVRFFRHEEQGRCKVSEICRSLRLGNRIRGGGEALVGSHLRPILLASEELLTTRAQYRFFRDLKDLGIDLLLLGWADLKATVEGGDPQLDRYLAFLRRMLRYRFEESPRRGRPPLIRGRDIMEAFGLPPGPSIGLLLERIQEAEAEGKFQTRAEGLSYLGAHLDRWMQQREKTD